MTESSVVAAALRVREALSRFLDSDVSVLRDRAELRSAGFGLEFYVNAVRLDQMDGERPKLPRYTTDDVAILGTIGIAADDGRVDLSEPEPVPVRVRKQR